MTCRMLILSVVILTTGVVASLAAGGPRTVAAGRWVIRDLGTLGGERSEATAINDRGQIVGWADTTERWESGFGRRHAVLWQNGRIRDLGTLGGPASDATGINDRGQVIGNSLTGAQRKETWIEHAFLRQSGGGLVDLGTLGGYEAEAEFVDARGRVFGDSDVSKKHMLGGYGFRTAFVWERGRMRSLGRLPGTTTAGCWIDGVSANGRVIGACDVALNPRGFYWSEGRMQPTGSATGAPNADFQVIDDTGRIFGIAGRTWVTWREGGTVERGLLPRSAGRFGANAANARGQVVGFCEAKVGAPLRPCLFDRGRLVRLALPARTFSGQAFDVNDSGQIVGQLRTLDPVSGLLQPARAVVWAGSDGAAISLDPLIGGRASEATRVNERGQIIGWATTRAGTRHAVLWSKTG